MATKARAYTWRELAQDSPMDRLARQRIIGDRTMLSMIMLHEGCFVPEHSHENEQFACVLSGRMKFIVRDDPSGPTETHVLTSGQVLHLPSYVAHSAEALEDSEVLDIFTPVSEGTGIDRDKAAR